VGLLFLHACDGLEDKPASEEDAGEGAAGMHGLSDWRVGRGLATVVAVVCVLGTVGCRRKVEGAVTLSFVDPEWATDTQKPRSTLMQEGLDEFTRKTGIVVKHLPAPEGTRDQKALALHLLQQGADAPDVYGIDVIWPGALGEELVDLKPVFGEQLKGEDPALEANYTVNGRLVAVPYHTNVGTLLYRTDLLEKYGFRHPPRTWDELEMMAERIQKGERAAGNKDFWGYVWGGAQGEGLTCDALEWQAAAGGGRIVEADGRVSVNNPKAIEAWQRAAHWVGWISPPSVISYRDWDIVNSFKSRGNSAFARVWTSDYFLSNPVEAPFLNKEGQTSLPGPGVLGGSGLAVSRSSTHQTEAMKLIQFLLDRERKLEEERARSKPPERPVLTDLPAVLKAYAHVGRTEGVPPGRAVVRPSTVAGVNYERVSTAYFEAVYSVLTGKATAADAATKLEEELVQIPGLRR
jgi:trehalose/maltose transport system substrate-binding protein